MIKYEPSHLREQFHDEYARIFNRQRLKSEVSEAIFELMEESDLSKSEFAKLIGTSKSHISQMLGGSRNFTLETLADIFLALGRSPHLALGTSHDEPQQTLDEWKNSLNWQQLDFPPMTDSKSFKSIPAWESSGQWNHLSQAS